MRKSNTMVSFLCSLLVAAAASLSGAAERHIIPSRVPADSLAEARALRSPLPDSHDIVAKGGVLYRGKGNCFNCHGRNGEGDGPAAASLDPSPRNFHHHGFWRHRTEGELFWVIKYGSPGTSMIGFGDVLSDEEIWAIIQYVRTFAGEHGPGQGMGPRGGMGHMGPHGSGGMGSENEGCCSGRDLTP